ncbi:monocarboxylate transporter 12-like [Acanthaster planci]|uniref:Monocarboxylate transporter 12-like n=1 Tax=Acanthaster planci TaxID=133434 RepID=A0A8B7ZJF2_ACAPL|nr:monocarboxylate transporter 12-like [Acanthaster planci]
MANFSSALNKHICHQTFPQPQTVGMAFPWRKPNNTRQPAATESAGGCRAAVVAVASFFVMFLMSTMTRCTGILYVSWQIAFDSTAVQTGVISSIISSTWYFASALSGVVCNRYGYRFTCILGGFLMSFAMLMVFWAKNVLHMYILGLPIGLGTSLCYMGATVAVADHFKKRYAIVSGLCMSGGSAVMVVSPPLFHLLLDKYGWRGTVLITAAVCANLCVAGALCRRCNKARVPGLKTRIRADGDESSFEEHASHRDGESETDEKKLLPFVVFLKRLFSVFQLELLRKSYRFLLLCITSSQVHMTYSCAVVFLVPRAQFRGIDELRASFLLSIFGFGSLGARVASGFLVTLKTPVEALYACSFVLCFVGLLGSQAETYESFAASACIVGISIGASTAWANVLLRKFVGVPRLASGQAIMLLFCGVGNLIGPIVAGAAYDGTGAFSSVFYVLAGLNAAAALQMLLMPVLRRVEPGLAVEERIAT